MKTKLCISNIVTIIAVLLCTTGCTSGLNSGSPAELEKASQQSDPLAGWKSVGDISYRVDPEGSFPGKDPCDRAIIDDVKSFIQTFPPQQRGAAAGPFDLYEDGTGQHAVGFEVFVGPYTSWHYALFYDQKNKRVRTVKYGKTRRMS